MKQVHSLCAACARCARALRLRHLAALAALPLAATAQTQSDDEAGQIEEMVVTAHPLSGERLSEAATVLADEALEQAVAASIGDTLGREPGIHNADFGTAVGRPVIHGLAGPRVRVMEDRIDAMDVSAGSGDHAVAIEPFLAERVEVLKGPSTLLYGSGAIGGVVDIQTGRVPQQAPENIDGRVTLLGTDNGDGTSGALRLDGGGNGFAWHFDGFVRKAGDYDIPGFAESEIAHAAEEAEEEHHDEDEHEDEHGDEDEHEDEHEEEERAYGTLPGSFSEGRGAAFGLSRVGERGFVGLAVSRLRYEYGLPGESHSHAHGDEEEEEHHEEGEDHEEEEEDHEEEHHDEEAEGNATLDLEQTRIDVEAGLTGPFGPFAALNFRFGMNDYAHVEVEPGGEIGTRFATESYEGRVELADDDGSGMDGVLGVQFGRRDFSAIGEEAFVPPVETSSVGAFWVGERALPRFDVEAGLRLEQVSHEPTTYRGGSFTAFSASLGVAAQLQNALLGVNGSFSSRAPSAEALYSNGPHLAVGSFEIGDPNLDVEAAWHGAATLAWTGDRAELTATAYVTNFRDHIYQYATGEEEDELPVLRYGQADARFAGIDLAASVDLARFDNGAVALTAQFDTVSASLDITGNDKVPRLPPTRYGVGIEATRGGFGASLDYLRVSDQTDTAEFELPTDGYGDLRLHLRTKFDCGAAECVVFLRGRNLGDEEQRRHTSIVKDYAPAPGRTLELGVRAAF